MPISIVLRRTMPCAPPISPFRPGDATMIIAHIIERARAFFRYRETVRELSKLSDRELDDLGISRGDIASIAAKHSFA
jgi:uncharacterized protein YjiS (DUF1127 family)